MYVPKEPAYVPEPAHIPKVPAKSVKSVYPGFHGVKYNYYGKYPGKNVRIFCLNISVLLLISLNKLN